MLRKPISLEWKGETHEVLCTPALLLRIEDRERGIPIRQALSSERIIDSAWVVECALTEAGAHVVNSEEVIQAAMDDMAYFAQKAADIMLELVLPEAAKDLSPEPASAEGNGPETAST